MGTLPGGVRLFVDEVRKGVLEAALEFSVPRLCYGSNGHGASLRDTHEMAAHIYNEAAPQIDWLCDVDQLALMRLDLVRDFKVPRRVARDHLTGLTHIPARRARTVAYTAPGSSTIKTLYRKTERWRAKLYDRAGFTALYEEQTTVRYELQLRSRWLHEGGLQTLGDLDEASTAVTLEAYFERCRFGAGVGPPLEKWAVALAGVKLTNAERRGVLGQLVMDSMNERAGGDRDDRDRAGTKYRQMAMRNGMAPGDLTAQGLGPGVRRLDYVAGQLVA